MTAHRLSRAEAVELRMAVEDRLGLYRSSSERPPVPLLRVAEILSGPEWTISTADTMSVVLSPHELLSRAEAAEVLRVSVKTVDRRLPTVAVGRRRLVRAADVLAYMRKAG